MFKVNFLICKHESDFEANSSIFKKSSENMQALNMTSFLCALLILSRMSYCPMVPAPLSKPTKAIVEVRAAPEVYQPKGADPNPGNKPKLLVEKYKTCRDERNKDTNLIFSEIPMPSGKIKEMREETHKSSIIYIRNFQRQKHINPKPNRNLAHTVKQLKIMDRLFQREHTHNEWWPLRFSANEGYEEQKFNLYYAARFFNDGQPLNAEQAARLDWFILEKIGTSFLLES